MREFSNSLEKLFTSGLRQRIKVNRKTLSLYDLYNFIPTEEGMIPYTPITNPISQEVRNSIGLDDETFPSPQIIIGKSKIFLCASTKIYIIREDDWDSIMELETYDPEDTGTTKAITEGHSWQLIDFWDTFFLTNGVCTVFASAKERMIGGTYKAYVFDKTPINCGTAHKGRVLFGGFDPDTFWDSTWQAFWNKWYDKNKDTGISQDETHDGTTQTMPIGENWIWWSSIGGGDALMLFYPSLMQTGVITSSHTTDGDDPLYMRILKKNEQGFAPMPFQGMVQRIMPMDQHVLVFTDYGVMAMRPVSAPSPTYEQRDLQIGGICNKGAVAGNKDYVIYLDNSGHLVKITDTLQVTVLGYNEFLYSMVGKDVQISYSANPQNLNQMGEFYISDGYTHFYYTERGLSEIGQWVTSATYFQGSTIGYALDQYDPDVIVGKIGIDGVGALLPGLKTLESVRVIGEKLNILEDKNQSIEVSIDYKYDISNPDVWTNSGRVRINKEGVVHFPVTALMFRINIYTDNYANVDVDYVEYTIKYGDRREKRSVPISQALAGSY